MGGLNRQVAVGASSCHDSLIFMSTHKATAARCLSRHQATYGLPPSTFNKRQHANARYRVESLTLYALPHGGSGGIVLITYGEGGQDNCIQRTVIASTAEPSGTN